MLLQDARREARADDGGRLVLLADQDRSRWDRGGITEGMTWLGRALADPGPYTVQAAIAVEHVTAATPHDTDWSAIVGWYDLLLRMAPTPVIAMNRAVAVAMRDGPLPGLDLLDPLLEEPVLRGHHLLHGARAQLLRRAGQEATRGQHSSVPVAAPVRTPNTASTPTRPCRGHEPGIATTPAKA